MLVFVCVACSQEAQQVPRMTSTSSATGVDAIRQMYSAFVAAKLDRDVQRELSFVTDDAVYSPTGIPDVAGKPALRAWWTSREAADSLEVFELDPGEIIVVGDLAYSRGTSMSRFPIVARDRSATKLCDISTSSAVSPTVTGSSRDTFETRAGPPRSNRARGLTRA